MSALICCSSSGKKSSTSQSVMLRVNPCRSAPTLKSCETRTFSLSDLRRPP